MTPADYAEFHEEWLNAHAMSSSNQEPRESTVQAVFDVLIEFPLAHVLGAIQVHARKSRFAPTPADICEIIERRTGSKHVGADEAWALVLKSLDENETVVLTKEIVAARVEIWAALQSGDKVAARMAFKAAYERIIENAPAPVWYVSIGEDKSRILDAMQKAVDIGRLPASAINAAVKKYHLKISGPQATVAGLLESAAERIDKSDKEAVLKLTRSIKILLGQASSAGIELREENRQAFEQHRNTQLAEVSKRIGAIH